MRGKIQKPIPSAVYDKNYFLLSEKDGGLRGSLEFKDFVKSGELMGVYKRALGYKRLNRKQCVLDIGSGRGELVCYLAKRGIKSYGIDYSEAAVAVANDLKKTLPKNYLDMAEFKVADCVSLPFSKESFDAVFMIDVVEHLTVAQMRKSLLEAKRVLKKGGVLIIHTPNAWFEKIGYWLIILSYEGLNVLKHKHVDGAAHVHINNMNANDLKKALFRAKFRIDLVDFTVPENILEMKKFLPYGAGFKEKALHSVGLSVLKSPLRYFLSPSIWVKATRC